MAQYKVPQDVEADDKLLGPFSFRQFVYLLVAGVLIALAVGLYQLFPLLAIIPVPPILLFAALALPLKKDQPMETYLAAVASYYLKPRNRVWMAGQRGTTITIMAPKVVDDNRTRDITGEEATHRLSFLADIVDTEGYAIKGGAMTRNHVNAELAAEATTVEDMFETSSPALNRAISQDENTRHSEVIEKMKAEIAQAENINAAAVVRPRSATPEPAVSRVMSAGATSNEPKFATKAETDVIVKPEIPAEPAAKVLAQAVPKIPVEKVVEKSAKSETKPASPSIIELANNPDYSVATIAKEANRIKEREEGEVFISLH